MKATTISKKIQIFLLGLFFANNITFAEQQDEISYMQEFQAVFRKISTDEEKLIPGYIQLGFLHNNLPLPEKIQASQFMAMLATTLGMYQDAENHHHSAFPASKSPGNCPASGTTIGSALNAIKKIAEN